MQLLLRIHCQSRMRSSSYEFTDTPECSFSYEFTASPVCSSSYEFTASPVYSW